MVLLAIISLFRVTTTQCYCWVTCSCVPGVLLAHRTVFLFFGLCCIERRIIVFQSCTLFIFAQLLPGSASWKPSKESASKHESPTHLRKHVKSGKEGDCFDAKMRIPLACSRKWIDSQLLWSRWEHKGQQPFTQQNDKRHLKVETSQGRDILASFSMSIMFSIFSA